MKQKIQRFGGAMFTPVLLFAFAGIMVGIATIFRNTQIMGPIAEPTTIWYKVWFMIEQGAWTVFNQLPLLFAISLPISLAKKQNARACMEAFVIYLTFNYFLSALLLEFGPQFGINFAAEVGGTSGLAMIAGIKTLDTGMMGAILVSAIVVFLHNKFYDIELPDYLGAFKGSAFVVMIGFFVMIPVALGVAVVWPKVQYGMIGLQEFFKNSGTGAFKGSAFVVMIGFFVMIPVALGVAVVWPKVQYGMIGLQEFFKNSGTIGVGAYVLLQKLLLPLGLHHFIYAPVLFDSVIVEGGTIAYWANHLNEFVNSTAPLIELYPMGGFSNGELAKVFGVIGVAWAFYSTAKPNKKKMVLAIMIPATLTSIMTGITEPLEFTFLFVAPVLYIVYSILAAVMAMVTLAFGIIGNFGTGLPNIIFMNIIPLFKNREMMYLTLLLLGIAFIFIHYIVFKFMILKFDYKTPGREDDEDEIKLYTKDDYNSKNNKGRISSTSGIDENLLIEALGGKDNILEISNCATRLRLAVADENLVKDLNTFKKLGAVGLVKSGKSIQVIIGLNVPKVRENIEMLIS